MTPINERFPIGFWNYVAAEKQFPKDVKDWADLGMTMANSPEFHANSDPAALLSILDECEKEGIRVTVCDERTYWAGASSDREGYEKRFREAYEQFGHHPAVQGFHVGDEPSDEKNFADAVAAVNIQRRVAPELNPFLNLLPYWKEMEQTILHCDDFPTWLEDFSRKANLKTLCYDHYWQLNPEESGTQSYFRNLRHFVNAAKKTGAAPWTTLLSVGHFRYRCPSEDDLRWQLNTAVASGMKGILWFFVYEREPSCNYRLPPIDEFGERTPTFGSLSRVNRHFLHRFGDFFLEAEHLSTYHYGKSYGEYPLFRKGETDPDLYEIRTEFNSLPGIVSFFRYKGRNCVVIVNNSVTDSAQFRLWFNKTSSDCSVSRLNWNGDFIDFRKDCGDALFSETEDKILCGDWLAPGQMNVYRLEKGKGENA